MRLKEIEETVKNGGYEKQPQYVSVDFHIIKDHLEEALEEAANACQTIEEACDELSNREFKKIAKEAGIWNGIEKVIEMLDKKAWFEASRAYDKIEEVL